MEIDRWIRRSCIRLTQDAAPSEKSLLPLPPLISHNYSFGHISAEVDQKKFQAPLVACARLYLGQIKNEITTPINRERVIPIGKPLYLKCVYGDRSMETQELR